MRLRRTLSALLVATVPLTAWAKEYQGVIGTRLLNDAKPTSGADLYLGFLNGTANPIDITVATAFSPEKGFDVFDMPRSVAPGSSPALAAPNSDYAVQHPLLAAAHLAFANFPQPGQGHFRYRRDLNMSRDHDSTTMAIWDMPLEGTIVYRLTPRGHGAGPRSGVTLTITSGYELGGFDPKAAAAELGKVGGAGAGLTLAQTSFYALRTVSRAGWSTVAGAYAENPVLFRSIVGKVVAYSAQLASVAMLQATLVYLHLRSALGLSTFVSTTSAYARLGGDDVTQVLRNPLQQTVRSADGRYEYTLSLLTLPYVSKVQSSNVPNPNDGLLLLGVRPVFSAEKSCNPLGIDADDPEHAMLRGSCQVPKPGAAPDWIETALELDLCKDGADVANRDGVLACESRFTGPFEQTFHKYDGHLAGSYTLTRGVLEVWSGAPARVLAKLDDPQACQPGSITYSAGGQGNPRPVLSCTR